VRLSISTKASPHLISVEDILFLKTLEKMKSAYELAMERLEKEDPQNKPALTDSQKKALTEIDERFKAKRAEREIFLQQQIARARAQKDLEGLRQLERQLSDELMRIENDKEAAKEQIRQQP